MQIESSRLDWALRAKMPPSWLLLHLIALHPSAQLVRNPSPHDRILSVVVSRLLIVFQAEDREKMSD